MNRPSISCFHNTQATKNCFVSTNFHILCGTEGACSCLHLDGCRKPFVCVKSFQVHINCKYNVKIYTGFFFFFFCPVFVIALLVKAGPKHSTYGRLQLAHAFLHHNTCHMPNAPSLGTCEVTQLFYGIYILRKKRKILDF